VSEIETNTVTVYSWGYEVSAEKTRSLGSCLKDEGVLLVISITHISSTNTENGMNLMLLNHVISYYRTVKYLNILFVILSVL
jgi:hypothetical protein